MTLKILFYLLCFFAVLVCVWYMLSNVKYNCNRLYSPYCKPQDIKQYLDTTKSTKVIWSFWHDEKCPPSVSLALNTWKHFQPNFIICLLSKKSMYEFIPTEFIDRIYSAKSYQEQADMLRIVLLERYGGYWIDSTIYIQKSISELWEPKDYDIGGFWIDSFTTDSRHKVFENWFIVTPRNSPLIKNWREEFFRALDFGDRSAYIKHLKESGVNLQNISGLEYLMMHCCFLKVTHGDHPYKLKLFSVYDPNEGPFVYISDHDWKTFSAVSDLITRDNPKYSQRMLKLRGDERKCLDNLWMFRLKRSKISKLERLVT